jgi:hypothetical protein
MGLIRDRDTRLESAELYPLGYRYRRYGNLDPRLT